jgi:hypothetical protein
VVSELLLDEPPEFPSDADADADADAEADWPSAVPEVLVVPVPVVLVAPDVGDVFPVADVV